MIQYILFLPPPAHKMRNLLPLPDDLTISFCYGKQDLQAIYSYKEPGLLAGITRLILSGIFLAVIAALTAWGFTRERGQEKSSAILAGIFAGAVLLVILTRLALIARSCSKKKTATTKWIDSLAGVKVILTCDESGLTFFRGDTISVTGWPDVDYMEYQRYILLFTLDTNHVLPAAVIPAQQYDALREWLYTHIVSYPPAD